MDRVGRITGRIHNHGAEYRTDREALELPISTVNHCVLSIVVATPNRLKQKIASPIFPNFEGGD